MQSDPSYPGPKAGGAWLVLFERFKPMQITTQEKAEELGKEFDKIREWLSSQSLDINAAYDWAMKEIMKNVLEKISQARKYAASQAAYHEIPRPPEN